MVSFRTRRGSVPVAWRQLRAEPAKLVVALVAVAAAVSLVLLLSGLRRGMGEQVTTYLDHQPAVVSVRREHATSWPRRPVDHPPNAFTYVAKTCWQSMPPALTAVVLTTTSTSVGRSSTPTSLRTPMALSV